MASGFLQIFSDPDVDHFVAASKSALFQFSPKFTGILISLLNPLFEVGKVERQVPCVARRRNTFGKSASLNKLTHRRRAHLQLSRNRCEAFSLQPQFHDGLITGESTSAGGCRCRDVTAAARFLVAWTKS